MEPKPIAHILGILLMNSCNTDRFLATTVVCGLSTLNCNMCIVSTVSSLRVVGNVSVCGVNKVDLRKKILKKIFCNYIMSKTYCVTH